MGGFRRVTQLMLSFIAIIALICAIALFYPIPYLTAVVVSYTVAVPALRLTLAFILSILAAYVIFLFFRAVFVATKHGRVVMEGSRGEMSVSKHALEATVNAAVQQIPGIYLSKSDVTIYDDPADTTIDLIVQLNDPYTVLNVGQRIQKEVKRALQQTLQLKVREVNVTINQMSRQSARDIKQRAYQQAPRVR